jgi:hypothetical protein
MRGIERLSDFPWVTVRIECLLCPHRHGSYRLARLAEKFGSETMVSEVLDRVAFDTLGARRPAHDHRTGTTRSAKRVSRTWTGYRLSLPMSRHR